MPKRLLRGVIDFGDNKISVEELNVNYKRLAASNYEWANIDERKLWTFIKGYFQNNHEAPSAALIHDWFERNNELTVTDKLTDLRSVEAYVRTHYATLLEQLAEDQNKQRVRKLLQEVEEIVTKGKIVNKETIKGVKAGLLYFNQKIYEAIPQESNAMTEGDVTQDANSQWMEFQEAKINKGKVYGRFTGIEKIDTVCHGVKPGEMWVHAAAPGQLKTTFALNWGYNLITRYRANVLYVSLEMKYQHLRKMVGVMHSTNGRFRAQGYKSLDYRKVRDGELQTAEEEAFYKTVLEDLEKNPEYHRFKVWAPDHDVTIGDIRVYAELMQKSMDVGLIVIDHGGLVKSSRPHKDYTIELNSVLREAKKLALHFNGGAGVPVLMLFQINRQGLDTVEKKKGTADEGRYGFSALSYANECMVAGTLVKTERGLIPIEKVVVGDRVWSRTGWKDVLDTFEQGVKPVYRVVCENGTFIDVTADHRLRVLNYNGDVDWVRTGDITDDQYLIGDFGTRPFPTEAPALPPLSEPLRGVTVPTHLTPHLAYLMGVYQAEGLFDHDYNIGYVGGVIEPRLRLTIEKAFLLTFDNFLGDVVNPVMRLWLKSVGMDHRIEGVAPIILQAPRELVVEYLRGFFDVTMDARLHTTPQDGWAVLLQQIHILLSDLGIDSYICDVGAQLNLRIRSHSFTEFWKHFSFSDFSKQDAVLKLKPMPKWQWNVPFRKLLSSKAPKGSLPVVNWIKTAIVMGWPTRLEGVRPTQIARVVELSPAMTYDIQVTGDHEYSTGSFLSHNCERSADYVTTSYLNDELKKQGVAKMGNLKNRDNDLFELTNVRVDFSCRRMWNWEPSDQIDIGSGMDANMVSMFDGIV